MINRRLRSAWTPWLFNTAVAVTARLLLPIDLSSRGERYTYYWMTGMFPYPACPALHCYRFLSPLLTWLAPTGTVDAFIIVGFVLQTLAGVAMWHLAARLSGSSRVALLATAWYWASWNPIYALTDPLLITDPSQAVWGLAALYLLLSDRHGLALAMLISGAAVKETVPLVAFVYAGYALIVGPWSRRRVIRLAILAGVPAAVWLGLRFFLHSHYGYSVSADYKYGSQTYLFGIWLKQVPRSVAALYVFGAFGGGWILGAAGLAVSNREQRAIAVASIPAMLLLSLFQTPDRALASFPYAVLIPAAMFLARVPGPLAIAVLIVNALFTARMNATLGWLPPTRVLLPLLIALVAAALWLGWPRTNAGADRNRDRDIDVRESRLDPIASLSWILIVVSAIVLAVALSRFAPTVQATLTPPAGAAVADDDASTPGLAVSPDGGQLAFVGRDAVDTRLWIQPLPSGAGVEIPGTDGASAPFWSSDGARVGFFASGKVKVLDLRTKAVTSIADAPVPRGGAWGADEIIVFAPTTHSGLFRVSASGGSAVPLTSPDASAGHLSHRWPSFLPDGRRFLFGAAGATTAAAAVYLGSVSGGTPIHVRDHMLHAAYAPGYVLFGRDDGMLMLQPFDLKRNALLGEAEGKYMAASSLASQRVAFSLTAETLVYARATASSQSGDGSLAVQWRDRGGRPIAAAPDPILNDRATAAPEVGGVEAERSPDGRWIAYSLLIDQRPEIFVEETASARRRWQVSTEGGIHPHWRGDGSELFFVSGLRFITVSRITSQDGFHAGLPEPLFAVTFAPDDRWRTRTQFGVSADGQRFMLTLPVGRASAPVTIMRHWLPTLAP